jgi:hypothetical protein
MVGRILGQRAPRPAKQSRDLVLVALPCVHQESIDLHLAEAAQIDREVERRIGHEGFEVQLEHLGNPLGALRELVQRHHPEAPHVLSEAGGADHVDGGPTAPSAGLQHLVPVQDR